MPDTDRVSLRKRAWQIVEVAHKGDTLSHRFDVFILALIVLNVIAAIASTVQSVADRFARPLAVFEVVSVLVFTVEYLTRVWSCVEDPRFRRPLTGRLRFMITPMAMIDFLAVMPFYLGFLKLDLRSLRILRLVRFLRVAKLARYTQSLKMLSHVVSQKKEELILSGGALVFLIILSASFMYYAENGAQPDAFSSIPATMWWSVVTLTTVGYGDIYPITVLGKCIAGCITILGVAMVAIPTGILSSGFMEALHREQKSRTCPHCGKPLE